MRNIVLTLKKDEELEDFAKSAKPCDIIEPEEENYRVTLSDGSVIHIDGILCLEHGYLIETCFVEEGCRKVHFVYAEDLWSSIKFEPLSTDELEDYLADLCDTKYGPPLVTEWQFCCLDECITAEFVAKYTKFLNGKTGRYNMELNRRVAIYGSMEGNNFYAEMPYSVFWRNGELYVKTKEYGFDFYHLYPKTENEYQDYIDFSRELCRLLPE